MGFLYFINKGRRIERPFRAGRTARKGVEVI